MPAAHWQFLMHRDAKGDSWSWRRMRADGSIDRTSEPLPDYGQAVEDAIRSGFAPDHDSWVVIAGEGCTHYAPGQKPATVPPDAPPISRSDVTTLQGNEKLRRLRLLARQPAAPMEKPKISGAEGDILPEDRPPGS